MTTDGYGLGEMIAKGIYEVRCRIALRLIELLMIVLPLDKKRESFAKCIGHSGCFGLNKP